LGGDLKTAWETLYQTFSANDKTKANFQGRLRTFSGNCMPPTLFFLLQKRYKDHATKPNCYETAGRLPLINQLSDFLPGSNNASILPDEVTLKQAYQAVEGLLESDFVG
jgi:hypothetical protein